MIDAIPARELYALMILLSFFFYVLLTWAGFRRPKARLSPKGYGLIASWIGYFLVNDLGESMLTYPSFLSKYQEKCEKVRRSAFNTGFTGLKDASFFSNHNRVTFET